MRILIILFSLFACINSDVYGQKENDYGFQFAFNFINKAKVPFLLKSNLIIVQINIDDSQSLNFILDTGVSNIILTDSSIAKTLGFKYTRQFNIEGIGGEKSLKAYISINHQVKMGSIIAPKNNIIVLEDDKLKLSEYLGIPIHGIFGHSLFERFVVYANYSSKNLTFFSPEKFRYKQSKYGEKMPLEISKSKPTIEFMKLSINNDSLTPVKLVVDTGAGHSLLLNAKPIGNLDLPNYTIKANLGVGLNGEINGLMGRVNNLVFGDFQVKDILASFPEPSDFGIKIKSQNRDGSLGGDFLRRFKVLFNYNEKYIAFKGLKYKLNEPFEHDMSGISVKAKGENYDTFYVAEIMEDSPAALAGVKVNDEIEFINGVNVKDLQIGEINKLFSSQDGLKITLFVKRNGVFRFFNFTLKRII